MAGRCWDLDGLAHEYSELLSQYSELPPPAELAALPGDEALRRQVMLVASYRRLPFRHPDLPDELLPEDWPGSRVHELFRAAHHLVSPENRRKLSSLCRRSHTNTSASAKIRSE